MKSDGERFGGADEGLRENMLAGVLLHVIEAARPVDLALNFGGLDGPRYHVQNRLVALADNHIFHWHTVDRAAIVRLAAGGGIEICLIENEGGVIVERSEEHTSE